ncbi:MAG: efflux RND transporter periplasmic adaptor subunit [Nitrospiraceae bacterium]|nr:MAG: efflux RND transporter periplasmic adaptor subunit [Nitrospiraceae bacterium]
MKTENSEETDIRQVLGVNQSAPAHRRRTYLIILSLLVAGAVTAVIMWKANQSESGMQYKTQEVRRGNLTVTVTATGRLEPTNQVDVGSELSGIVAAVEADYNDRVGAGQVLARLDTSKIEAQILKSKAALASAEANVQQTNATVIEAENKLARLKQVLEMSKGKVPSRDELGTAEAALQRAKALRAASEAAVAEARATLDVSETDLAKTVIRSPVNGIVLVRAVEPGQTVAASLQAPVLFTLAEDLTKMELLVNVDEADVGQVSDGQNAEFTVDAYPDRTYTAQITQVRFGAQTVEGVVTYETVMSVDNSDLSLRPGMTATADIVVKKIENEVLIPNAALRFTPPQKEQPEDVGLIDKLIPRRRRRPRGNGASGAANKGGPMVWVVTEDSKQPVRPLPVKTGLSDGSFTSVIDGSLEPGQPVIVGMETENE